jgi:tetratricopeptide (TPR) repeat protein
MLGRIRMLLPVAALLFTNPAIWSQESELPPVAPSPAAPKEVARRDALHKFVYGVLCEKQDRLLEALKAFEESAQLDPSAPAVHKARVSILLVLDRGTDALVAARKTLELDPGDYEIWCVVARLCRSLGKDAEASDALRRGLVLASIHERPELAQQMYRDLGDLHEAARDFAAAADAYAKAAQILEHPDLILEKTDLSRDAILERAAEMYERAGTLARQAKKYDQAIEAYRKAQERAPDRAGRINFLLAELCQEQGRPQPALTHLDAYLRLQPLGLEGYELKATLLRQLGRAKEIVPWLEQTVTADRHNTALRLLLARELGRAGEVARAEPMFRELAEAVPNPEAYLGWFNLYRQQGEMTRVLKMFDETASKTSERHGAPPSVRAATRIKAMIAAIREDGELARQLVQAAFKTGGQDLQFETLQFLAVLADQHRQETEAEHFYRRCLPQATPANEALLYGGLLRTLLRARKYEAMLKVCEQGLAQAKATSRLFFLNDLARAEAGLERYDEALRHADEALTLANDDNRLVLRLLRLRILSMAERYEQAETECLASMKDAKAPGDALELRYLLASIYSTTKQLAKSEEQLQLILKADPNNATANNDLGYIWADQGKHLAEAEAMIRKALEQDRRQRKSSDNPLANDQDNAAYVDSLGWVLFRLGRLEEARQELERATKLPDSDDPVMWDHLGDVYERLQRSEQARAAWQRALGYYEQPGHRRRADDRQRELQRKLQTVRGATNAR